MTAQKPRHERITFLAIVVVVTVFMLVVAFPSPAQAQDWFYWDEVWVINPGQGVKHEWNVANSWVTTDWHVVIIYHSKYQHGNLWANYWLRGGMASGGDKEILLEPGGQVYRCSCNKDQPCEKPSQPWIVRPLETATRTSQVVGQTATFAVDTSSLGDIPLNVRAGPGTEYAIIDQLSHGQMIKASVKTFNGSWHQAVGGYVDGTYLRQGSSSGGSVSGGECYRVVGDYINIRDSPWGRTTGSYSCGTEITIVRKEYNGGAWGVTSDGYVALWLLRRCQ